MKNKEVIKNDITFIEACKILGKSERTLSRYIKNGLINPERIKSERGTIQYRFSQADLESLKIPGKDKIRQDIRPDRKDKTGQDNEVITLLKETKT